jgi:hypothetical protein
MGLLDQLASEKEITHGDVWGHPSYTAAQP